MLTQQLKQNNRYKKSLFNEMLNEISPVGRLVLTSQNGPMELLQLNRKISASTETLFLIWFLPQLTLATQESTTSHALSPRKHTNKQTKQKLFPAVFTLPPAIINRSTPIYRSKTTTTTTATTTTTTTTISNLCLLLPLYSLHLSLSGFWIHTLSKTTNENSMTVNQSEIALYLSQYQQ